MDLTETALLFWENFEEDFDFAIESLDLCVEFAMLFRLSTLLLPKLLPVSWGDKSSLDKVSRSILTGSVGVLLYLFSKWKIKISFLFLFIVGLL